MSQHKSRWVLFDQSPVSVEASWLEEQQLSHSSASQMVRACQKYFCACASSMCIPNLVFRTVTTRCVLPSCSWLVDNNLCYLCCFDVPGIERHLRGLTNHLYCSWSPGYRQDRPLSPQGHQGSSSGNNRVRWHERWRGLLCTPASGPCKV